MKKGNKMFIMLLVFSVILFSGLVLNFGSISSLSLIDYHPMSIPSIPIPVIF